MRGFTAVEVAVLFLMMAVLVALVLVLAPTPPAPVVNVSPELKIDGEKLGREMVKGAMEEAKKGALGVASVGSFEATKTECMNNVRNLAALLTTMREFPTKHGGVNLLLWLVNKGDLEGEDNLKILFCPGDTHESLEDAGGVEAYVGVQDARSRLPKAVEPMPLNIKNPEVERLVAEIAALTGESKTEAVRKALRERRARLAFRESGENRQVRLRHFMEQEVWAVAPEEELGRKMSREEEEAILGYGPEGV